jgi:hypothetical protein
MGIVMGAIVVAVVFTICVWGGRTLSRHYNDRWEVAAALAVAMSVLAPFAIWDGAGAPFLAGACALGLMAGYNRRA